MKTAKKYILALLALVLLICLTACVGSEATDSKENSSEASSIVSSNENKPESEEVVADNKDDTAITYKAMTADELWALMEELSENSAEIPEEKQHIRIEVQLNDYDIYHHYDTSNSAGVNIQYLQPSTSVPGGYQILFIDGWIFREDYIFSKDPISDVIFTEDEYEELGEKFASYEGNEKVILQGKLFRYEENTFRYNQEEAGGYIVGFAITDVEDAK